MDQKSLNMLYTQHLMFSQTATGAALPVLLSDSPLRAPPKEKA